MTDGYYYLHSNGSLHFKKFCPEIEDGGFVRMIWPLDLSERGNAWVIAIEAGALGADKSRIEELREKWGLTDTDAWQFARASGMKLRVKDGMYYVSHPAEPHDAHVGTGRTALDAFIDYTRHGDFVSMPPQLRKLCKGE